ncbi:MAG: hypothetical protein V2A75_02795 [Pseudomonadota bacterium]
MKRSLYVLYILLIVIVMIPKEKLYFTFESILSQHHLFINNEELTNRFLFFDALNGNVLLDNQEFASIESIRIAPLLFINQLSLSNINFSPLYRNFFPGKIDSIVFTYSLLHPLSVSIDGEGDFGQCEGDFDLLDQKIRVVFEPTPQLRRYPLLVNKLHQAKEGLVYESNF